MANRRVVITGVSGGIGAACGTAFADAGWDVIGFDRRPATVEETVWRHVQCDVSDASSIVEACASVATEGPLDALVNNAAVQLNRPLGSTTNDEWDLVMNTNVRGSFICMRELLPALEAADGAVVNVASVHAVATSQNISAYAASKGALVALTRAGAVEFADRGVRINAVLPGAVDTPMLRDGLSRRPHPDGPDGNLEELRQRTPMRVIASPDDIAKTVVFLADSQLSPYITGQSLVVDGGATARLSTE